MLAQLVDDMRPFMLPVFFYAGKVKAAAEVPGVSSDQVVALKELRALLIWALLTLGIIARPQARPRPRRRPRLHPPPPAAPPSGIDRRPAGVRSAAAPPRSRPASAPSQGSCRSRVGGFWG